MKVLVVGSGGREHALAWRLKHDDPTINLHCAPGNGGTSQIAINHSVKVDDIEGLLDLAKEELFDLTIVGPELPLTLGIVDRFGEEGLPIFGSSEEAARIEGSKVWAKTFMRKYGIPTADFYISYDPNLARIYGLNILEQYGAGVVKADGLAGGKGVIPYRSSDELVGAIRTIMIDRKFGDAGNRVVIERFLPGEEASFLVFTDGEHIVPLSVTQDHKPVYDGDKGPNTGGMGVYGPASIITPNLHRKVMDTIVSPTVQGLSDEGIIYKGILYCGLMVVDGEPHVLEYNCRFGDPETQPQMMLMNSPLLPILHACREGNLNEVEVGYRPGHSVCVVLASKGYPGDYKDNLGRPIHGLELLRDRDDIVAFHAGTKLQDGQIVTSSGRVLGITSSSYRGLGDAIDKAYSVIGPGGIWFDGMHYREDIGSKGLR